MLNQSEDRRARRSRKLLKQGLLELMGEKRFSQISVRDITERMDLNRGTFYLHYPDTTALLQSLETDILREAQEMVDQHLPEVGGGTLKPVFEPILDYIVEHQEICRALFINNSTSNFVDRLHELIRRNGAALVRERYPTAGEQALEDLLNFLAYGLIGLMKGWFDQDMAQSKESLVKTADLLVSGAAERLLAGS